MLFDKAWRKVLTYFLAFVSVFNSAISVSKVQSKMLLKGSTINVRSGLIVELQ